MKKGLLRTADGRISQSVPLIPHWSLRRHPDDTGDDVK